MPGQALRRRDGMPEKNSQPSLFAELPEQLPPPDASRAALLPASFAKLEPVDSPQASGPHTASSAAAVGGSGEKPDPVDVWSQRLYDAFKSEAMSAGFLPLAEEAIKACPGEPLIFLQAATAALLDGVPARALVFVKRFSKRARAPAQYLMQALALHQQGKTVAARGLLTRHGLTNLMDAFQYFPGGVERVPWLAQELDDIMDSEPAPARRSRRAGRHAVPKNAGRTTKHTTGKTPASARAANRKRSKTRPVKSSGSAKTAPPVKPSKSSKSRPAAPSVTLPGAAASPLCDAPAEATASLPPPALQRLNIDIPLSLEIHASALSRTLSQTPERDGRWFSLRERLAHLGLAQGFDELLCLNHCSGFTPLPHQFETLRKVLKSFRGRVLLADEVGLGKTVEACMVLKEYALRGMAEKTLVLTPASLVGQWREELETKVALPFATTYDPLLRQDPQAFWGQNRIVASIATARRRAHADILQTRDFDLVICDEAHHLRDRRSQSWKLVDGLNKRFLLLLSATPVQNNLIELYNLLTLLKPGIFKTQKEFRAAYMTPGKPRQPANPERLRALMRDVMIRNTRAVAALKLPRRHALTIKAEPAPGEAEAYADLVAAARDMAGKGAANAVADRKKSANRSKSADAAAGSVSAGGAAPGMGRQRLALHHLLAAAGSSPKAAAAAVARIAARKGSAPRWDKLALRLAGIELGGKEAALMDLLRKNGSEKKLVFVQSRDTLDHLSARLDASGFAFARFDGSMSGPQKDAAIEAFRDSVPVLLCTQSGGEGRNIQFCNTLINFDLPFNPMAIEQRIGRIDRIGQTREIFIFNLVMRGTLEEQVLALLDEKISMFELVVGEVGAILGGLDETRDFGDLVLDAWLEASDAQRNAAFGRLGNQLDAARRKHDGAKDLDEKLFGDDFEAA